MSRAGPQPLAPQRRLFPTAATSMPNYGDHFKAEKVNEWPDPKAVYLMEAFAREDVDRAVHLLLLREDYVVKKLNTYLPHLDFCNERRREILHKKWVENVAQPLQQRILEKVISVRGLRTTKQGRCAYYLQDTNKTEFIQALCDPLIWRQHGAENRATQCDTGKRSSLKEFKDTQTARLPANLPHFTCTLHRVIPKDRRRTSARSKRIQGYRPCRPEMITCTETKELFEKVEKTTDPSQRAFEKQFIISRLNQETKRDKRKELVFRGRQHRPRSWAAGERYFGEALKWADRQVMRAEDLAKHLAALRVGAQQGHAEGCQQ